MRSRRFISRSIASRMRLSRGSSGSRTASMRAVVPAASGTRRLSSNSFLRPMRRFVGNSIAAVNRLLQTWPRYCFYHGHGIISNVNMIGA